MILIIKAELSEPPTEPMSFRDVTMASKINVNLDVLIECAGFMKDSYWYFLRPRGMMDFVEYLITPEEREDGIRLDAELNYPRTIVAERIVIENSRRIIDEIKIVSRI